VIEEKEEIPSIKRSSSHLHPKQPISVKDLKEPLQLLSLNTPSKPSSCATPSKGRQGLSKQGERKGVTSGMGSGGKEARW
jgi:hypothetical protein